jgi:hypothetical protein
MSSKAFTAKTFAFLHGVNTNTKLRASDLKVAMAWTWYFNEEEGGQARVGCKTVGDRIGLSESTVVRSLHRLEAHGHIRVVWGKQGRGHPNHVWMVVKPAPEQVSEAEKPAPAPTRKPAGVPRKPAAVQENLLKNHHIGGSKEPPNMEGERDSIVLAHDSTPPDRGRALTRRPDLSRKRVKQQKPIARCARSGRGHGETMSGPTGVHSSGRARRERQRTSSMPPRHGSRWPMRQDSCRRSRGGSIPKDGTGRRRRGHVARRQRRRIATATTAASETSLRSSSSSAP